MASTYSTSLRLELMATGDQSGTWGDTTNTNLGTLLEQAITGVLSVAQGDTTLTLTSTDGASDQARNAVVNLTGAMTAIRNVVVPTASKLYTIKNSTTGGFSVVVKTTSGTGVSVPPGASIDVYCDGTNVVAGADYWSGQIGGQIYLDAGATVGPVHDLFRDSTSPATNDILGQVLFNGRDSAGNKQEYASIEAVIADATSASEDSVLDFYVQVAGVRTRGFSMGNGVFPFGVIRTQVFTASGTYTPHANMVYCEIEAVGGGGGGGGIAGAGANTGRSSPGGGSGSWSKTIASKATIGASQTVTIGGAGAGGAAGTNSGSNGGDTSVGSLCVGKGGTGGAGGVALGGLGGVAGTGDITTTGAPGESGLYLDQAGLFGHGGNGGSSKFGGGGVGAFGNGSAVAGNAASGRGAGGAGASAENTVATAAGGTGTAGYVVITEYCSA
jgi:hypothetical protein